MYKELVRYASEHTADLTRAADLVSVTIEILEEFRSDQEW